MANGYNNDPVSNYIASLIEQEGDASFYDDPVPYGAPTRPGISPAIGGNSQYLTPPLHEGIDVREVSPLTPSGYQPTPFEELYGLDPIQRGENPYITSGPNITGTWDRVLERGITDDTLGLNRSHYTTWQGERDLDWETFDKNFNPTLDSTLRTIFGDIGAGDYAAHKTGGYYNTPYIDWTGSNFWSSYSQMTGDPRGEAAYIDYDPSSAPLEGTAYDMFFNPFSQESIADFVTMGGGGTRTPGEFKALNPELVQKADRGYYDPVETAERAKLTEALVADIGKVGTGGGFAGSGTRDVGLSQAESLYKSGYGDLIGQIGKMQGAAEDDLMDIVYSWT